MEHLTCRSIHARSLPRELVFHCPSLPVGIRLNTGMASSARHKASPCNLVSPLPCLFVPLHKHAFELPIRPIYRRQHLDEVLLWCCIALSVIPMHMASPRMAIGGHAPCPPLPRPSMNPLCWPPKEWPKCTRPILFSTTFKSFICDHVPIPHPHNLWTLD